MTAVAVWIHQIRSELENYQEACAIADTRTSIERRREDGTLIEIVPVNNSVAKILPLEIGFRKQLETSDYSVEKSYRRMGICFSGNVNLVAEIYFAAVNLFSSIGVYRESPEEDWPDIGAIAKAIGVIAKRYTDQFSSLSLQNQGANFPSSDIALFGQIDLSSPPEVWKISIRPKNFKAEIKVEKAENPLFFGHGGRRLKKRWENIVAEGFSPGGDTSLRALGAMIGKFEDVTVGGTTQISVCRNGEYTVYQTKPKAGLASNYIGINLSDFDQHLGGLASGCIAMDTVVAIGSQKS